MLATLAFAVLATQQPSGQPKGVEMVVPNEKRIVVQLWAKAPFDLKEREAAAWRIMGDCLLKGAGSFSEPSIREYGGQYGILPRTEVFNDLIHIEMVFPPQGMGVAGEIFDDIVTRASLRPADINTAIQRRLNEAPTPWEQMLMPQKLPYEKVTPDLVKAIYSQTFRPDNFVIGAGGVFEKGELASSILSRCVRKDRAARRGPEQYDRPAFPYAQRSDRLSTFELQGSPLLPSTNHFAARMLAWYAMGGGKSSSVFRVIREKLGMSYRQEALLWPTSEGWIPRVLVARRTSAADEKTLDEITQALLEDIETWDDKTLARAQMSIRSAFERGMPTQVIWLSQEKPMSDSLSDRLALRCWLELVGAGQASLDLVLDAIGNASLASIKAQAKEMVETANGSMILGV